MSERSRAVAVAVGVGAMLLLRSPEASGRQAAGAPTADAVMAEGYERLPFQSLEDWKSYSDAVVLATVRAETEVGPGEKEGPLPPGAPVGRIVELDVSETVFSRNPEAVGNAVSVAVPGWVTDPESGRRQDLLFQHSQRIVVGKQYLLALVREHTGTWSLQTPRSAFAVEGGTIVSGETDVSDMRRLGGSPVEAFESSLQAAPANAQAEKYANYSAIDRWAFVSAEITGEPAPERSPTVPVAPGG